MPWAVLWLLAGVVSWILLFRDVFDPDPRQLIGRDFSNLWMAGKLAWSGNFACIFDPSCFRTQLSATLGVTATQNYSYPPHALFIAMPFAVLPYYSALAIWTIGGIFFFTACARSHLPKGFPYYLAAFTTAGWLNIWAGHYGFLLGGLWLLFFRWIDQRPGRAGLIAGLLTFKPHLGLVIAVTALRRRMAITIAVATTLILVVVSAVCFGPGRWIDFLFVTTATQSEILTATVPDLYFRMMPSAYVAFGRGGAGIAAQLAFDVAAIWLLWRNRRWDAFSAATATFLIVPYVFNYDMTVACLGFAVFLYVNWQRLHWYERAGMAFAFLSPELTFYVPQLIPFGLLYALILQLRRAQSMSVTGSQGTLEPLAVAVD